MPILYLFSSVVSIKLFGGLHGISALVDYLSLFYNSRVGIILIKTLIFAFGTALLTIFIGVPLAFLFEYTEFKFKDFFKYVIFIPLIIPPYLSAISWMSFVGARGNLINLGFPVNIYNLPTAIILMSLSLFPIVVLFSSLALRNVDRRLEDAARLIKPYKEVILKISFPLIIPHILIAGFFIFILSLSEYGVPSLLRVNTYSNEIFAQFSAFFNIEGAIILSLPLVLISAMLILVYNFYLKNKAFFTLSSYSNNRKEKINLSGTQESVILILLIVLVLVSAIIPIGVLIIESKLLLLEAAIIAADSIKNSFFLATLGATLMTGFGFIISYFTINSKNSDIWILFTIAIPSSVIGIALINFWNHTFSNFIYSSLWMIIFGYFINFLPFVVKSFSPFISQISPSLEEASAFSRKSFLKKISKIVLPLAKPGLIFAFILGFILSLRELGTTLLVSPPGFQTLPTRIETLMHYGNMEIVASLSLLLILLISLPLFILFIYQKKLIVRYNYDFY